MKNYVQCLIEARKIISSPAFIEAVTSKKLSGVSVNVKQIEGVGYSGILFYYKISKRGMKLVYVYNWLTKKTLISRK